MRRLHEKDTLQQQYKAPGVMFRMPSAAASLGLLCTRLHLAIFVPTVSLSYPGSLTRNLVHLLSSRYFKAHAQRPSSTPLSLSPIVGSASSARLRPPAFLVRVGDGNYSVFKHAELMGLDRTALLTALAESRGFSNDLKGTPLGKCTVFVLRSTSKVPTKEEEVVATELLGKDAIRDVFESTSDGSARGNIFAFVRMPEGKSTQSSSSTSSVEFSAFRGIELSAEHLIPRVIAAIRAGQVETLKGGHLALLPEGLSWPAASNNVLFVRKFYAPLFESVLNRCLPVGPKEDMSTQRRIVTGQPGIGKSVWGWYVIYRVLREQPKRTVVFASQSEGCVYVIPPADRGPLIRAFLLDELPLLALTRSLGSDPLLVADSILPPVLPFPTVVVSSSDCLAYHDRNNVLNHYCLRHLYMPVPTTEELLQLHALAFSHLDEEGVRARMELWGPIPRHVLVKWKPEDQMELQKATPVGAVKTLDAPHHCFNPKRAAGQDTTSKSEASKMHREAFYLQGAAVSRAPLQSRVS